MGQKTPASSLRVSINRDFDLQWYKEPNYYADLFIKDYQYRKRLKELSLAGTKKVFRLSHKPESSLGRPKSHLYFGRILSSISPKSYQLRVFYNLQIDQKEDSIKTGNLSNQQNELLSIQKMGEINRKKAILNYYDLKLSLAYQNNIFASNKKTNDLSLVNYHSLGLPDIQRKRPHNKAIEKIGQCLTNCRTHIQPINYNIDCSAEFFLQKLSASLRWSGDLTPFQNYAKTVEECLKIAQQSKKIRGIRIVAAGRFKDADRGRMESHSWGRTALHELDNYLDYAAQGTRVKSGLFGIKVWVLFHKKRKKGLKKTNYVTTKKN